MVAILVPPGIHFSANISKHTYKKKDVTEKLLQTFAVTLTQSIPKSNRIIFLSQFRITPTNIQVLFLEISRKGDSKMEAQMDGQTCVLFK